MSVKNYNSVLTSNLGNVLLNEHELAEDAEIIDVDDIPFAVLIEIQDSLTESLLLAEDAQRGIEADGALWSDADELRSAFAAPQEPIGGSSIPPSIDRLLDLCMVPSHIRKAVYDWCSERERPSYRDALKLTCRLVWTTIEDERDRKSLYGRCKWVDGLFSDEELEKGESFDRLDGSDVIGYLDRVDEEVVAEAPLVEIDAEPDALIAQDFTVLRRMIERVQSAIAQRRAVELGYANADEWRGCDGTVEAPMIERVMCGKPGSLGSPSYAAQYHGPAYSIPQRHIKHEAVETTWKPDMYTTVPWGLDDEQGPLDHEDPDLSDRIPIDWYFALNAKHTSNRAERKPLDVEGRKAAIVANGKYAVARAAEAESLGKTLALDLGRDDLVLPDRVRGDMKRELDRQRDEWRRWTDAAKRLRAAYRSL